MENNGKSHWFLYILLLAAVAGGIWYFWNGSFDVSAMKKLWNNKEISADVSGAVGKGGSQIKGWWKEKIDSGIKFGIALLTEKPKEIAGDFISDIKTTALESARKQADKALGVSGGSSTGLTAGGGGASAPPQNISIVRPARQSLSLLITAENEDISYTIDWGDSLADKGQVIKGSSKTVEHVWAASGEYAVKVSAEGKSAGTQTFIFPITILK